MISVIIPAYNAGDTLPLCIDALMKQEYLHSYEVIVVDDGSTDRTGDIARRYDIRYFRQPNQGPATARNNGTKEANGEIILFTDSDCVPDKLWIREMVRPFEDEEVAGVKGAYKTKQKSLIARFAQVEFEERFELLRRAKRIDMVDTYSAAFRRDIFWKMGGFDESFPVANNEDTDFSYKLSSAGYKMVFNPNAVVYHLNHPDSIKRYVRLKFWRGYWRMVVYKKYPNKMLKDSYTPQTLKLQIMFLFLSLICLPLMGWQPHLMFYPLTLSVAGFVLSALPLTVWALRKDLFVGIFSPLMIFVRAASLGLGIIWGSCHGEQDNPMRHCDQNK
jgi:glycosyltransferase involved in cell wall biosynthesis